ncbi:MAG: hypothetical protein AB3N16_09895 [Flavobacteriaceae bacterium]
MNKDYIRPDAWSIIEEGYDPGRVKSSESLFALGNGAMGQRANFEEDYSGPTFQGSYIAGVYYPDKTRVGWWKNGYPEYFAKVLNAPNWIGIKVIVDGEVMDLAQCQEVSHFRRELNMREGWYRRTFTATLGNGAIINVEATRFLSLDLDELGAISYQLTPINQDVSVTLIPYLDSGIKNEDSNWDDQFWETTKVSVSNNQAFIEAHTLKTLFATSTFMEAQLLKNGKKLKSKPTVVEDNLWIGHEYQVKASKGETVELQKFGGYTVSRNHGADSLVAVAQKVLKVAVDLGFSTLLKKQKEAWGRIWEMSDITIEGDVKAQQGIRFNIFQLNQTYTGTDSRLNIGPKGFTGEKYGGGTYWDTEGYCLPFFFYTQKQKRERERL